MRTDGVTVTNIPSWLRDHTSLMESCLSPLMRTFVVKAMFYVIVKCVQVDAETGAVVARREEYIPSGASEHVVNLQEWYESHITRFSNTLNKFMSRDGSEWIVEGLSFVLLKVSLTESLAGCGVFKLPETLKKKQAVVNVDCDRACFKYAVLSVLHYNDISKHRQRVTKYAQWENELKFDGLNVDEMDIRRDVPKFEKMNDLKVNIHVWDKGLQGIRYNSRKNTSPRTVNLLLIVGENGRHHYCGIPKRSRLYHHTQCGFKIS